MIIEFKRGDESYASIAVEHADDIILHYNSGGARDATIKVPFHLLRTTLLGAPGATVELPMKCDHLWHRRASGFVCDRCGRKGNQSR